MGRRPINRKFEAFPKGNVYPHTPLSTYSCVNIRPSSDSPPATLHQLRDYHLDRLKSSFLRYIIVVIYIYPYFDRMWQGNLPSFFLNDSNNNFIYSFLEPIVCNLINSFILSFFLSYLDVARNVKNLSNKYVILFNTLFSDNFLTKIA